MKLPKWITKAIGASSVPPCPVKPIRTLGRDALKDVCAVLGINPNTTMRMEITSKQVVVHGLYVTYTIGIKSKEPERES